MNILFPMAGLGTRLSKSGYKSPKPLVKILDKMLIEWSIKSIGFDGNFIFCCKKEHLEEFDLENILKRLIPSCEIVSIDYQTQGTAQTILEAKDLINSDEELFLSDSDHFIQWNSQKFLKEIRPQNIDACVMVFPQKQNSTTLSYVSLDQNGFVTEAAEKIPISDIAACGMHYYKKGSAFVTCAEQMIKKDIRFNDEFYVTPIYNEFVRKQKYVISFPINKKWALGSPKEINKFLFDYKNNEISI